MKVISKLNKYFLADEGELIHWTDYAFFYGTYSVVLITVTLMIFN